MDTDAQGESHSQQLSRVSKQVMGKIQLLLWVFRDRDSPG